MSTQRRGEIEIGFINAKAQRGKGRKEHEGKEIMRVKDLIEKLQKCDPDGIVVMAKGEEGNGYSELAEIEMAKFDLKEMEYIHPDDIKDGYYSKHYIDKLKSCAILWPH